MKNLTYLRTGTPRLYRVVNSLNHQSIFSNRNIVTLKRCLSNISNNKKNENDLGINTELYKTSTTKKETPVPNDLKGGQTKETFDTTLKSTASLAGGKTVWSVQDPGSVYVAPLAGAATTFIPTLPGDGTTPHKTVVHATQGEVHVVNASKPHVANSSKPHGLHTDTVFSPKMSSTDLYSTTYSPTGQYEHFVSSGDQYTSDYETSTQSTVFGGQHTSASSKTHQNKSGYNANQTSDTTEIPIQCENDIRANILRESLKYVNDKGWTMEAIRAGVRESDQPTTIEGLFANGYDLVEYFIRDANSKMSVYMDEKFKKGNDQKGRLLVDGLKYRLGLVIPYASTWDQALAQGALPQNAVRSWRGLFDLSDAAWHGIHDESTDINWYSKRLLLAAVYKSSEIYMLQDQSIDKIDTMNFLERRLNDFQAMGSVRNSVMKSFSDTAQVANGLFAVVRNLTSRR